MEMDSVQYKQILDSLSEAVYCVDMQRRIVYWNKFAERLTGYGVDEVIGVECADGPLQHVDVINRPLCENGCPLVCCIETGIAQEKLVFALHKNGNRIPVLVKTSALYDDNGAINGAVESFTDATELLQAKEVHKEILRQTHFDALTGVPNKQALFDALDREWFRFKRYNTPFSLMVLDVDYFSSLKAAYGQETADAMLQWLVKLLRASLRRADIVGRIADDKFMVLLSFSNRKSTLKVANMVVDMVRNEICLDLPMAMTISVGAVTIEDDETLESIISRSEKALERSKEMGRNQVTFWG
ncbi:MAG: hypothetical protein B6I36_01460 [Desulfobacteraceae bacterium 4572_35.1]|nr:MAG: hypothetical protein B6I36_01460 [Desulfobacteraceae bacterium 4572_35.1]